MRNTFGLISSLWLGALAVLPASAMPLARPPVPESPS